MKSKVGNNWCVTKNEKYFCFTWSRSIQFSLVELCPLHTRLDDIHLNIRWQIHSSVGFLGLFCSISISLWHFKTILRHFLTTHRMLHENEHKHIHGDPKKSTETPLFSPGLERGERCRWGVGRWGRARRWNPRSKRMCWYALYPKSRFDFPLFFFGTSEVGNWKI